MTSHLNVGEDSLSRFMWPGTFFNYFMVKARVGP